MWKLEAGDMFSRLGRPNEMVIVTANASVKVNGELVMGRGAAKTATTLIPGLAKECGRWVKDAGEFYGFLPVFDDLGLFQVKHHWFDRADISLIGKSCLSLAEYMREFPVLTYNLNFPGVGNGGMSVMEVVPVLDWFFSRMGSGLRVWVQLGEEKSVVAQIERTRKARGRKKTSQAQAGSQQLG